MSTSPQNEIQLSDAELDEIDTLAYEQLSEIQSPNSYDFDHLLEERRDEMAYQKLEQKKSSH